MVGEEYSKENCLIAKKLINEILFSGGFNLLWFDNNK